MGQGPVPAVSGRAAGRVLGRGSVLLLAALLAGGCWYRPAAPQPLPEGAGTVELGVRIAAFQEGADQLTIVLRQGGIVLEHSIPLVDGLAADTLEGVYAGTWDAVLEVRDREGYVTHRGQSQVTVYPDEEASLHVVLDPLPGRLQARADLTGFHHEHLVGRARLYVQPGELRLESHRAPGQPYIDWQRDISPGTYDMQVVLYGESFHNHNAIYAGPWFSVDVRPGRTIEVTWQAATGRIDVAGAVRTLPLAPRDVTARVEGDEVVVEWVTVSPRAVESAVWWSPGPWDMPREVARVPVMGGPGHVDQFRHRPGDEGALPGSRLVYAVTSVDGDGLHSLRTAAPPVLWTGGP